MKILQINAVYGILSTGITTKQLSDYLTSNNIENEVIYGLHEQKGSRAFYIGSKIRRKVDQIMSRIFKVNGYFSFFSTIKALRFIHSYKPDIIHLRNLHEYYINVPILLQYIYKKRIAVVITLHDCFFFTGYCPYYTINNCYKWKTDCLNCDFYNLNVERMFSDKYNFLSKIERLAVVGVSDWVTNEARQSKILGDARIITRIYNWIDLDLFKPCEDSIMSDLKRKYDIEGKFVILCVSAVWSKRKRLDDIISVSESLGDEYRVMLLGDVNETVHLPANIINIPTQYNISELVKFYSLADVFMHLSLEETFGKVTAEALSCGTPVIVYNSTASPELVSDACGIVVEEVGDINRIIIAIQEIRRKGKDYYSINCRQYAKRNFCMENNMKEYLDLYNSLLCF